MIGKTPLIRLENYENAHNINAEIFAKLESFNEFGSVKDRVAKQIIADAERGGNLRSGYTIIEATSGNTGIALAGLGRKKGYKVTIIMSENTSDARKKLIKSYGANLILTDASLGMSGAVKLAQKMSDCSNKIYFANQFENYSCVLAHKLTTAPEIYEQMNERIDVFIAGIGTGGTISGVGEFLKIKNPNIKIIGVEPASSPFFTKGKTGKHKIEGIGAGFSPKIFNKDIVDEIIPISDEDAINTRLELEKKQSICVGTSSGAVLCAAKQIATREEFEGKRICIIFADSYDRYK